MIDWDADHLNIHKDEAQVRIDSFFKHFTNFLIRLSLPNDGSFGRVDMNLAVMYHSDSEYSFKDWLE